MMNEAFTKLMTDSINYRNTKLMTSSINYQNKTNNLLLCFHMLLSKYTETCSPEFDFFLNV